MDIGAQPLSRAAGFIFPARDTRNGGEVAATFSAFGKGRVGAVDGPVASKKKISELDRGYPVQTPISDLGPS